MYVLCNTIPAEAYSSVCRSRYVPVSAFYVGSQSLGALILTSCRSRKTRCSIEWKNLKACVRAIWGTRFEGSKRSSR